ncbi:hypothetical protein C0993_001541, partial [Termitomyces sp. T159_Od127]
MFFSAFSSVLERFTNSSPLHFALDSFSRDTKVKEQLSPSRCRDYQDNHCEAIKEVVMNLLNGLHYAPPNLDAERSNLLFETLVLEFGEYSHGPAYNEMCRQASAMAELSYHEHPIDVQLQIARFTWFMLYIDDLCGKFPGSLEKFQKSILSESHPDHAVLAKFRKHLVDMYEFWDFAPANGIIISAMEFVTGCALEEMPGICDMKLSVNARSWPYFLRAKTGVAAAYAFMIFPRCTSPRLSEFIQVIGDISLFIDLTNDVLSFYKEELAGETKNYVHNAAYVNQISVQNVLKDILRDALAAQARVSLVLHGTDSYKQWSTFVQGYL